MDKIKYNFSLNQKNQQNFFIFGTALAVVFFLLSLWHRWIHIDDAWLGEQVYWLIHDGHVRSELFHGFMGHEEKLFVWHKLYIWQGALISKLFGFNIYYLKSLSLAYLGLIIFTFRKIFNFYKLEGYLWHLGLLLLFTSCWVFELGFTFRPDLAVTSFGLLSFYCLKIAKEEGARFALLAGILAGLATASHLNGILMIGSGIVLLIWRKDFRGTLIFAASAGLLSLFYLHDIHSLAELHTFWLQFKNDPSINREFSGPLHYLWKLIDEQRRYLHSPMEIAYTLLLTVLVLPNAKLLFKKDSELVIYVLTLCLLLALISHGKTSKYLIYAQPFFFLAILISWPKRIPLWKVPFILICLGTATYLNIKTYILPNRDEIASFEQLASILPENTKIVAPLDFIFNQIERFEQIQGIQVYEFFVLEGRMKQDAPSFFSMAAKFNRDYIVLNAAAMTFFEIKEKNYPPYEFLKREHHLGYSIFINTLSASNSSDTNKP
ncbi:ArnT family glycosyltransferase [Bdellovibrio svalbardensis]|uniref:Glycosyltransferase family 39 protein n=1 Tax=Bdellovibrio svalbardensis TaxID=2972972 RepID=A0ABT6DNG1_9BACT|nr:hypothetical protein [Bdellovibrio svalbardensis]MDG0817366.1 glycosyltransferase family 39 protein [Bdellovibrio svalbardensis]